MALKSRFCLICRKPFAPDPRAAKHQKVCSAGDCQKERKSRKWRRWRLAHPGVRKAKLRLWAQSYPYYWVRYRQEKAKPAYRQREIQRMRRKRKGLKRVAKQTQFKTLYLERLRAVQALGYNAKNVAKQTLIERGLREVVDCLIWKENVAKHTQMDAAASGLG